MLASISQVFFTAGRTIIRRNRSSFRAQAVVIRQEGEPNRGLSRPEPGGKVPTLLVEGRPLTEVSAILFYLARRYPAAGLLPNNDIEAEARVISWMSFIAATIHPARRGGIDYARKVYAVADRRLGSGPWAVAVIRLQTFTCFGCIGVFSTHCTQSRASFQRFMLTTCKAMCGAIELDPGAKYRMSIGVPLEKL